MSGASTRASRSRTTGNKGGDPAEVVTGPVGDCWADHLRNVISTCGGRTCRIPGCDGPPTNRPLGLRSSPHPAIGGWTTCETGSACAGAAGLYGRGPRGVVTGPMDDWWADHLRNVIGTCGGRTCRIPGCDGPPTNHPLGLCSSSHSVIGGWTPAKQGQHVWDPACVGSRMCGIPGWDGPPTNHPLGLRSSSHSVIGGLGMPCRGGCPLPW